MSLFREQRRAMGRFALGWARRLRNAIFAKKDLRHWENLPTHILIIRPFFLGDILLCLPLAQALKKKNPQSKITWLLREEWSELIKGHSVVDEVLPFSQSQMHGLGALREFVRIAREIRKRKFGLVINLAWDRSTLLWTFLSGAGMSLGIEEYGRPRLLSLVYDGTVLAPERSKDSRHMVDFYFEPARLLGAPERMEVPEIFPMPEEDEDVQLRLDSLWPDPKDFILVHPGSRLANKRWPMERYAKLLALLGKELAQRVVLVCGPGEESEVANIASQLPGERGFFWPSTSLGEFIALAKRARLFIGNDSGPMHLAAASGSTVLALFGSDPTRWGPVSPRTHVLKAAGITNLSFEEVAQKVRVLLG